MIEHVKLTFQEVHVGTSIEKCREINNGLHDDGVEGEKGKGNGKAGRKAYAEDVFDNLVFRYEEPNGMTRWDSPLFTVPFEDVEPPGEAIWEAMIGSEGKTKTVKPNLATLLVWNSFTSMPCNECYVCYAYSELTRRNAGTSTRVGLSV